MRVVVVGAIVVSISSDRLVGAIIVIVFADKPVRSIMDGFLGMLLDSAVGSPVLTTHAVHMNLDSKEDLGTAVDTNETAGGAFDTCTADDVAADAAADIELIGHMAPDLL